ncbi:ABC transporter ATP-binding protein [Euzebya sp.]|uniref:ABC transporter ATP-binding protein n=1 Tax=Euzebya sp. TaxID=1971409 RepID=UPI003517C666
MPAIIVKDLCKLYGVQRAVDDLSFEVADGEVFALLGPNGAGKTTTVEILEGHRTRTSGQVQVLGFDPATGGRDYRERIGIVLQDAGLDEDLTVVELVATHAGFYPRRRDVGEVIELVGLAEKRRSRVTTLSGGQRRRLDLALGLIGDPELLFLDEPTTGFDPAARRQAWTLVERLRELGKTVLLTTHYLDEAEHLADRVAVVARGRLVATGTPEDLIAGTDAAVITFRLPADVAVADLPLPSPAVRVDGELVTATAEDPVAALHALTGWALARGTSLPGLSLRRRTLEEAYLQLVDDVEADDVRADDV